MAALAVGTMAAGGYAAKKSYDYIEGKVSPPDLKAPPTENDEEVKAAEAAERERIRRMRGRQSTILTQGQDLGTPQLKKTVLGGQ
jgi:hypothetical protein